MCIYIYVLTVKSHFRWVLLGMFLGHFIFVFLRKAKRAFFMEGQKAIPIRYIAIFLMAAWLVFFW